MSGGALQIRYLILKLPRGALPPVQLDASKIRFALLQVIDNAFKFSGGCGHYLGYGWMRR